MHTKFPFSKPITALLLLASFAFITSCGSAEEEAKKLLNNPQIGDTYVLQGVTGDPNMRYGIFQVWRISGDSLFGGIGAYAYEMGAFARQELEQNKHKDEAYWADLWIGQSRTELLDWARRDKIKMALPAQPIVADTGLIMSFEPTVLTSDSWEEDPIEID